MNFGKYTYTSPDITNPMFYRSRFWRLRYRTYSQQMGPPAEHRSGIHPQCWRYFPAGICHDTGTILWVQDPHWFAHGMLHNRCAYIRL